MIIARLERCQLTPGPYRRDVAKEDCVECAHGECEFDPTESWLDTDPLPPFLWVEIRGEGPIEVNGIDIRGKYRASLDEGDKGYLVLNDVPRYQMIHVYVVATW